jgi:hypothetical protein
LFISLLALAHAAPTTIVHQGRLLDAAGAPVNGQVAVTFTLERSNTTTPWTETHTLQAADGYYTVVLGNSQPFSPALLDADPDLDLLVTVGGTTSRQPLHSVPFAVSASGANNLSRTDCTTNQVLSYDGTSWVCTSISAIQAPRTHYVRWGRTSCPASTTELYDGWTSTGYEGHNGGPSNYLCLATSPTTVPGDTLTNNNQSILYQVQYRVGSGEASELTGVNLYESRCAVCEAQADQVLMVPGTRSCPSSWTSQYEGVLMGAQHDGLGPQEAICVDKGAEAHGSGVDNQGGQLTVVEFDTRSNNALPYTNQQTVACVVCSR